LLFGISNIIHKFKKTPEFIIDINGSSKERKHAVIIGFKTALNRIYFCGFKKKGNRKPANRRISC
jgi:hypothetical protein